VSVAYEHRFVLCRVILILLSTLLPGKTTTILGIIAAVGKGIIVTAPSNAAVANLAARLTCMEQFGVQSIAVWGENCDDSVRFLNPVHRNDRYLGFINSYSATEDADVRKSKLQAFSSWLRLESDSPSLEDVKKLCENPSLSLSSAHVVLCTLNTVGSTTLRKALDRRFDLLILDEASQCPEAEFYIATTFPGVRRIVMVGDPQQLSATVVHRGCQLAGYGRSFLANVMEFHPGKVFCLDRQYRMDPQIFKFSNELFYDSAVASDDSISRRQPRVDAPFLVVDTSGMGEEKRVNASWMNEYESIVIRDILRNDKDIIRLRSESDSIRTIIVSPYLAQTNYLRGILKKAKHLPRIDVATVDSFQGQEADIVIVSTVRTRSPGFTDDPKRLNVALTRAKRILRVVGDVQFLDRLPEQSSILRKLASFAKKMNCIVPSTTTAAWRPPDWSTTTKWQPVMTASFHDALKLANGLRRNIAFNTLLAIATPRLKELRERPIESDLPRWQMSSLASYSGDLYVVWVPLEFEWNDGPPSDSHFVGVIQAHFTGGRKQCLQYIQRHHLLPASARIIKRDLSAPAPLAGTTFAATTNPDLSWLVTNDLQRAVLTNRVQDLPEGIFVLDPNQEHILTLKPPLLLESRSGTGKTNVLFQHAVRYARGLVDENSAFQNMAPICFITVSPRLREELQRRFEEVEAMHHIDLPPIQFFSFQALLSRLLQMNRFTDMWTDRACSFLQYLNERRSYAKLTVEQSLVENEIGGVIVGSLRSALERTPLTKEMYLEERRSNVPNDTDEGRETRNRIYDEFKSYEDWKNQNNRYDIGDIVLRLIREGGSEEVFQSGTSSFIPFKSRSMPIAFSQIAPQHTWMRFRISRMLLYI
jgi:hypothetical protein